MCLATGLPPLNVLVVTQHGQQPGDEVVLRPGSTVAKDQRDVLAEDWFQWRAPVAGSFRAFLESKKAAQLKDGKQMLGSFPLRG